MNVKCQEAIVLMSAVFAQGAGWAGLARTRSTIGLRSNPAMQPTMTTMVRPSGPALSILSLKLTNSKLIRLNSSNTSRK